MTLPTIAVEVELLMDLLGQRDALIRAIKTGMASGEWDGVMPVFDALLVALKRLEDSLPASGPVATTSEERSG